MADNIISIYRIEYDRPEDAQHYTAYVGALNPDQATTHVFKRAGANVRITSFGALCRIDEFTPEVINLLKRSLRVIEPRPPVGNVSVEDAILAEARSLGNQPAAQVKGKPTLRG